MKHLKFHVSVRSPSSSPGISDIPVRIALVSIDSHDMVTVSETSMFSGDTEDTAPVVHHW